MNAPSPHGIRTRPVVIGVSGPDGAGKSALVGGLARALRAGGTTVTTAYCYGCVLCRRLPSPGRGPSARPPRRATGLPSPARAAHCLLDCAELALRLAWAVLSARARARGRPAVVLTDRGPLDSMVKYAPAPGSWTGSLLSRLAAAYDTTLLLDADPRTLASRDGEHDPGLLAALRERYRTCAGRVPSVVRLDSTAGPEAVTAAALRFVPRDDGPPARRVVLSVFDDAVSPYYRGGGAVLVAHVAHRLAEEFEVTVVTAGRRGGAAVRDGVRYRYLPVCWAGPRAGQLLFHALLPVTARRLPHDLWLESFTPPFSTSFLPLFTRAPVVGLAQSRIGEDMWRKYHLPFFLVERLGLRCYRDIVVLGEAHAEDVRGLSPHSTVHVVPNGVELPRVGRERLGQGGHILFLGRVDVRQKGLDLLLAAHAKARPALPLVLAGSGTRREERKLAALLERAGPGVRWLGHVDGPAKRKLLEESAFAVLPSRDEAFGLSALEALSYGKPVLHFDLPTLRWLHGAGGSAVPPFDVDALAERMGHLAADGRSRERLSEVARRTAMDYSWDQTTSRYLFLARHLLGCAASTAEPGALPGPASGTGGTEGGAAWARIP